MSKDKSKSLSTQMSAQMSTYMCIEVSAGSHVVFVGLVDGRVLYATFVFVSDR